MARKIKDKIWEPQTKLLGIGRLFSSSIGPLGENNQIFRKDLRTYLQETVGLTDEQLGNPYANVDVSNALLVLAFMKALHIQEVDIANTTSTKGMLIYAPYWS